MSKLLRPNPGRGFCFPGAKVVTVLLGKLLQVISYDFSLPKA